MKIHEALANLNSNPKLRARPVSWRGQYMAYSLDIDGTVTLFAGVNVTKTWTSSHAQMTCLVSELCEEWEVIDACTVENGE